MSSDMSEGIYDDGVAEMYKDYDLYLAAKNGDLDEFKRILDRVSTAAASVDDIFSRLSPTGNTFLHVAAKHGNQEIVAFVATTKPSLVAAINSNGETALHLAAKAGDESMVKALVQIHHDLLLDQDENNLLMVMNQRGNTALHEALLSGGSSIARYLIQQEPQLSYFPNSKAQNALYLAAKTGHVDCVSLILQLCKDEERVDELFKTKSPIQAAVKRKHTVILDAIFKPNPRFIKIQDSEGRTPLHLAASLGHLEVARYLLQQCALNATQRDNGGALPIHLAAAEGHVDVVSLLLQDFSDAEELLNRDGWNILHVAAMSGRHNVISFVLENPRFNNLINMKDKSGNTPLHWASMMFHPKIVSTLTWDKRVDIKAVNDERMTALDAAEENMSYDPQFRERLTWAALRAASVPRHASISGDRTKGFDMENYKERVNTLLLVATLVATMTFAAGFTMPGGYNSSDSKTDTGMATMLREKGFHVFVLCDTIAMYSSLIVVAALIWAQLGDLNLAITALSLAVPFLGIALSMMSMAFTAGIVIVVANLKWLSTTILAMGICFITILFLLLLLFCTPLASRSRILRHLSYYPFCFLMFVTGSSSAPVGNSGMANQMRAKLPAFTR